MAELHLESLQSVVPTSPTDPRISSTLRLRQTPAFTPILQRRFLALLCYSKARELDSGWHAAGWIKESLGMALQEQPLLAGRLRRRQCGDFEVVSNDSGVRLVEAKAEVNLDEFLESKEKDEGELVFWEDVAEQNPEFSPLFYVQVTNFTCGGYSVGISCSLLLADPYALTSFIKRWADIHNTMVPTADVPELPTFYLPNIRKPNASRALQMGSHAHKTPATSLAFNSNSNIAAKNLAALCINRAETAIINAKIPSEFALLVKEPSGDDAKLEICSRQELSEISLDGVKRTSWDDELGLSSVSFNGGKKPVYGTSWINSVVDHGFVMILPSSKDGTKIIVSIN